MGLRLLCVDDDRVNALLLEQVCLNLGGIELQCAENGAEAEALAADWRPDLLVIDLHLPDTDGCTLLPRLRAAADRKLLPAVLCTAEDPSAVTQRATAAGFSAVWIKPVMLNEVQAALQRLIPA
jgi:two-component system, OmpR family, response regulator